MLLAGFPAYDDTRRRANNSHPVVARLAPLLRRLAPALLLAVPSACGVTPDPTIADEFFERLSAPPTGWVSVPCPDREATVESAWVVVHFAHDLRAQLREFDTPLPPRLQERLMATELLGRVDDVRCVMHDFVSLNPKTDPDAHEVSRHISNLYVLKAWTLFDRGEDEAAWDHALAAIHFYGDTVAPGVAEHLTIHPVLEAVLDMLLTHPPPAQTLEALVDALEAALVPTQVRCAALRHELLSIAIATFRVHFELRERQASAQRYGLHWAMKAWRQHRAGQQGRALWNALRNSYDAQVPQCTGRPYGHTVQAGAAAQSRLDLLHPPTGVLVRVASDRLNRAGPVIDAQITLLATARAMLLRERHGRDPTTAELALSFGRRPRNPWDGRHYTFAMAPGVVTISRSSFQREVALPVPR